MSTALFLGSMIRTIQPNPVKSLIRNGVISGMGCQVRVRFMRRVWCAVVGEGWVATGSTIGVAWVNGHHPDFLSTWICQLKQLKVSHG